jgi:uncharacterized protein (DUF2062 family)
MSKKLFRKLIKRYVPDVMKTNDGKHLSIFGKFLHDPNLWHLNRYSVSTAFSVGLFAALIPVPFQMLLAASLAIIARGNIPISVALAWVSNPFTTPIFLFIAYHIGSFIFRMPPHHFKFEMTAEWFLKEFQDYGTPIILGCFVLGIICAIIGNIVVRIIWRISVIAAWKQRVLRRKRRMKKLKKKKKQR